MGLVVGFLQRNYMSIEHSPKWHDHRK